MAEAENSWSRVTIASTVVFWCGVTTLLLQAIKWATDGTWPSLTLSNTAPWLLGTEIGALVILAGFLLGVLREPSGDEG